MIIITIESHNEYGIGQKAYMSEHIDWKAILKTWDIFSKYIIRTMHVDDVKL